MTITEQVFTDYQLCAPQELQQDKDIWDSLMSTSFKTKQASKTVKLMS